MITQPLGHKERQLQQRGMGVLLLVGVTEMVSNFSARMSMMAMSIWIFQMSGSVLEFVLAVVLGALPMALLSPLAGVMADRHDRKRIIMVCDGVVLLMLVTMGLLYHVHALTIWHAYANTALMCTALTFREPAFAAAMGTVVPRQYLARANGMIAMSQSVGMVGAPLLAGVAMQQWGLFWVMMLNVPPFVLAILAIWQAPAQVRDTGTPDAQHVPMWRDVKAALDHLRHSQGLLSLALYGTLLTLLVDMVGVMTQPLLMSSFSVETATFMLSMGGAGALGGAALVMAASPSRALLTVMLTLHIGLGISMSALGATQAVLLSSVAIMATEACIAISHACFQAYWQTVIPANLLGRVLSLNQMATAAVRPFGAIGAALLADHFFEPAMMPNGLLSETVGVLIGTGKGRGIGLMFVLAGLAMAVIGLFALCHPIRRRLDGQTA